MKRSFAIWQLVGFAFTSLGGTLLHFLYDWLGGAIWLAPFSAVNESTWEHMKLLFWPMLIFAVVESFFFREREDFPCIKLHGTLVGLILIPVMFYGYNGIVGDSPDWLNIAIFFISAAIAYIYEFILFKKAKLRCSSPKAAVAIMLFIAFLFVLFTFVTPKLAIFRDPLTQAYGI